jgi:hypothetical protein
MIATNSRFSSPKGIIFRYGGGAYNLNGSVIAGGVRLELIGAAANTVHLLESLGFVKTTGADTVTGVVPVPPQGVPTTNQPIIKKTTLAKPLKGDIASQYDGTKQ